MEFKRIFLFATIILTLSLTAQVPRTMNYQGKLTDGSGVAVHAPGGIAVTFRIFDVSSGGTALWSEAHASVPVTNGLFDVILGETTPMTIDFDEQYWIELTVGGETLLPREKLSAVGYAHHAVYADTADYVIGGGTADNDWTELTSPADYIEAKAGGIASNGAVLHGTAANTHINLGYNSSVTGASGFDYTHSTVGGGYQNTASNTQATVSGGFANVASGNQSTVGGGGGNAAGGYRAVVAGGVNNTASGARTTIGGGQSNLANADAAFVGGGNNNTSSGQGSMVGAGEQNTSSNWYSVVAGGRSNTSEGYGTAIGGGRENTVSDSFSVVSGGYQNTVENKHSAILGGYANRLTGEHSYLFGIADTVDYDSTFYVGSKYSRFDGEVHLGNVPTDATYDSVLTIDGGQVKKVATSTLIGPGSGWLLTGNAGTVDGTNFIGTTDNVALNFRVNNQKAGRIGNSDGSVFLGYQAGNSDDLGSNDNTFIGYQAGYANIDGRANTAIGHEALLSNTTSNGNTAVGIGALRSNQTTGGNTAIGSQALYYNVGLCNVGLGSSALFFNTNGSYNVALGYYSLYENTSARQNIAIGTRALYEQSYNNGGTSWDSDNIAIGHEALYNNQPTSTSNGIRNIAIGILASRSNTTGTNNVAIGQQVLRYNQTGSNNIGLGIYALANSSFNGSNNISIGHSSGSNITTGSNNILLGYDIDAPVATNSSQLSIGNLIFATGGFGTGTVIGSGNVGIKKNNPAYDLDVNGTVQMTGFRMPTGASNGYVLTSNASGVGTWQAVGAGADGDWSEETSPAAYLEAKAGGIATNGAILYGTGANTHINLGFNGSVTGRSGFDYTHCTIGGGYNNEAWGARAVISGGNQNVVNANYAGISSGDKNEVYGWSGYIGGGGQNTVGIDDGDDSEGFMSSVLGGFRNTVSGNYSAIIGGDNNTVSGNYSSAFGYGVSVSSNYTSQFYSSADPGTLIVMGNVGIGTFSPTQKLDVNGQIRVRGGSTPAVGDVLTATSTDGTADWQTPSASDDGDWELDIDGYVLYSVDDWGLARYGATLLTSGVSSPDAINTHVNWGVNSTTGISTGFDVYYATVGGGGDNNAYGYGSTISGGRNNEAGTYSVVGGGSNNNAGNWLGFVGGGEDNSSTGQYAVVPGGYGNTAQSYGEMVCGLFATVGSGSWNSWIGTDRLFVVGNGTGTSSRSDAMTILKNGNTGIGTTAPEAPLDVRSDFSSGSQTLIKIGSTDGGLTNNKEANISYYWAAADNSCYLGFSGKGNNSNQMILRGDGNVGIGTTAPDDDALLDVSSTTKGFLPPRMTCAQRDAISSPPEGLMIYNTATHTIDYYDGSQWMSLDASAASSAPSAPTAYTPDFPDDIGFDACFRASWSSVSGATSYRLDVSRNSAFTDLVVNNLTVSSTNKHIDCAIYDIECGQTYYYRVRAVNDCGTSSNSNTATVTGVCSGDLPCM